MKNKFKVLDLTLVYILGIIVLANIISVFFFFRIDLTEGSIYSLSDASKRLVSGLDDKIIVKCFFSKELPPQLKIIPAMIKDNLDEYKAYSNGNFYYEFIDQSDKEFVSQIMDYQLPSAQVQMLEKDEFKVKKVFMGMVILYEDKKEIIPFVQEGDLPAIEYEITSKIRKLTLDKLPSVGILSDFGSATLEEMRTVYQLLSSQYVVNPVKADKKELNIDKIDALLIVGPKENFSQDALRLIDEYIISGGKVGFFIDKTSADLQKQNVKDIELNLDSLMMSYGVTVNNDLVGDKQAGIITVRQQKGFFNIANQIKYPFLPMITNLDRKNPVTQKIDAVNLYFASSLDTTHATGKNISLEILARTSENAFVQSKNYNIIADKDIDEYRYNAKYLPLIALLKGSFDSHFDPVKKGADSRIIVSGDAEFFLDNKFGADENINLFLNLVDWLTADETLISIRSKTITQRPLDKVADSGKTIIKWLNIALIPLLL
ncbi:MAG: Gldg family protein, partial [Candidatus Delongbacteria bacterium]|nr:Gldg family protein [Candidatus Delongbacteria bacterium]